MFKEAIIDSFQVLPRNLPAETEKNRVETSIRIADVPAKI
jgi:hypothetical protein